MEGDLLHGQDQQFSLYKSHIRNPMKAHQPFFSVGLLEAPPPYLPHPYRQQPSQPPLLPLPATHLRRSSSTPGHSFNTPASRNGNRTRHHSLTSKKSTKYPKKEEKRTPEISSDAVTVPSSSNLGSKAPSKNTVKTSLFTSLGNNDYPVMDSSVEDQEQYMLPRSVVLTVSPPPSSLPIPTFTLRRKLSSNTVAAGVNTGTSNDLRRLL